MNVRASPGLKFTFDRPPTGLMQVQHITYFQAHGVGLCHPGHWSQIGGSYATDDTIGVGLSPWRTGLDAHADPLGLRRLEPRQAREAAAAAT